ncbi:TrmH family RNA methyltransferase [Glaciecola petra]|uniref:RNA methyltransferase n=1 Tax=Glaciecola petra TaxID=3075602 RepID=A0ABU2ZQ22_9ALTE|nr:RNA methyltransferase [Aestuariibacter sp. P117]MDT0594371.1 RNA methyltransferase [Aestuariibacter sp. P117]
MKLSDIKKLQQKKYRTQFDSYLLEGEHLILELKKAALTQAYLKQATIYFSETHRPLAQKLSNDFNVVQVDTKQMAGLSNTKNPQGILACVPMPKAVTVSDHYAKQPCVYLHEIQDPGNLGTIIRTLAWFGDFRLLLSKNSVDPFNPKVIRASMGAIFHVPIEQEVSLDDLHNRFDKFAYLDMEGKSINSAAFFEYKCYLFGNEARGVPLSELTGCRAEPFNIEGSGNIDSLNVASAVNICVYELSKNKASKR